MNTINIDKLEELNGFEWEYQGKEFFFRRYTLVDEYTLALAIKKFKDYKTGEEEEKNLIHFSLKNLTELEFYGLKVILNEPKLTRKEREFLECHRDIYIARDYGGKINIYSKEPQESITSNVWFSTATQLQISNELFKFIVWESGKAWSKAELMELKVID